MTPETLIQICLGLPLVALLLVLITGKIPNLREASTITISSVLFFMTCQLARHVFSGARPEWIMGDVMMPGFAIAFQVEPLGMLFALVASGLWVLTTIYAIGYMLSLIHI